MKITLAQSTPPDGGPLQYTVSVDGTPQMASTHELDRAKLVLQHQIEQARMRRVPFTVVKWDGDRGEETLLTEIHPTREDH